jgi:hypothetical protein
MCRARIDLGEGRRTVDERARRLRAGELRADLDVLGRGFEAQHPEFARRPVRYQLHVLHQIRLDPAADRCQRFGRHDVL